jgi:hypothetical protein
MIMPARVSSSFSSNIINNFMPLDVCKKERLPVRAASL